MSLNLTYWNLQQEPAHATLDQVMDNLRNDDMREGLMYEPCTMDDVLDETQPAESLIMDAIISQYSRLKARMNAMQRVMSRTGLTTKGEDEDGKEIDVPYTVIGYQLSDPFMRLGTANVVALFELSDGQTVSIYFHNPDTTPKKIAPTDEVISFKWLLNKKDITIVVAPERGKDIDLHQVALRIMKIAHKNSEAFARQNKNRQERVAKVTALRERVAQKEKLLAQKVKKIDELKYLKAQEEVDQILEEDRLMKGKLTAALYQELKEKNRLTDRQDELDDLFSERIAAIRDALRQKGWNGERYKELNKEGIYLKTEWETTKETGNTIGMSYHIPEVDFHYTDDLSDNPEDIAQKIDDSIQSLLAKLLNEQKAKLETNAGKVEQYLKDQGYTYNSSDWTFDKVLDDREIAISVNERVVDIVVEAKKVGAASYKVIDEQYRFEDTALDVILGTIKDAEKQDLTQLYDEQSTKAKALNDAQIAVMGLGDKKENAPQEDQPIVITGKEFGEFDTLTPEGKAALREKAFEHLKSLAERGETVFCKAVNADVRFVKSAAKKYKQTSANPVKSMLAFKLKELIANGVKFKDSVEDYEGKVKLHYHYLKTLSTVNGEEYGVRLVLRQDGEGNYHYDLQVKDDFDTILDSIKGSPARLTKSDVASLEVNDRSGSVNKTDFFCHSAADVNLDNVENLPNKYGESHLTLTQSELQLDDTLTLDDVSSGYVLNLFVFDKDGNEIKDEEDEGGGFVANGIDLSTVVQELDQKGILEKFESSVDDVKLSINAISRGRKLPNETTKTIFLIDLIQQNKIENLAEIIDMVMSNVWQKTAINTYFNLNLNVNSKNIEWENAIKHLMANDKNLDELDRLIEQQRIQQEENKTVKEKEKIEAEIKQREQEKAQKQRVFDEQNALLEGYLSSLEGLTEMQKGKVISTLIGYDFKDTPYLTDKATAAKDIAETSISKPRIDKLSGHLKLSQNGKSAQREFDAIIFDEKDENTRSYYALNKISKIAAEFAIWLWNKKQGEFFPQTDKNDIKLTEEEQKDKENYEKMLEDKANRKPMMTAEMKAEFIELLDKHNFDTHYLDDIPANSTTFYVGKELNGLKVDIEAAFTGSQVERHQDAYYDFTVTGDKTARMDEDADGRYDYFYTNDFDEALDWASKWFIRLNSSGELKPFDNPHLAEDRQYLQDVIDGKVEMIFDKDFYPKFEAVCHRLYDTDLDLVTRAVDFYMIKSDEYAVATE